ncbi:PQQ-dependent sugar dehydrogenase [Flavihumibacter petaseus]|uniref:Putative L-sorbosone dehydrogenase n=1 Tax=Flavihumibacter petaseus NBRC 106054 TaxID=1220578 RepID=A0A0E9N1G8_9BACT|nr:PQQ-dependent sugar dehydrogenase [Flavihumibacter petaseus]GAO43471.1 putative L-sorbosone dehydrogenase [Flavihumibacter petaseus NBRC 106054]
MKKIILISAFLAGGAGLTAKAGDTTNVYHSPANIKVPKGFEATIIADELGRARHIAAAPNGVLFIKLERLKNGRGILRLQDADNNGSYEKVTSFGNYGGTGIAVKNGYLYASSDDAVYRYRLNENMEVADTGKPEAIVTGLLNKRQHSAKAIALDNNNHLYVNIGAPSNACQVADRTKGSPGQDPCPILDSAGGIWQFSADQPAQSYKEGKRYATGLRNVVGLDWNSNVNELFVVQHGRDQLATLYPELYNDKQSAELPAEELFMVKDGANCGWPYCYYDGQQQKKVLAPEFGGDGKKEARCADMVQPLVAFPAHLAPNALLFYTGDKFPARYRNGAFIAFHGSWNRAPLPQEGYYVVFVPFEKGQPAGKWEVFADGFSGLTEVKSPNDAKHRPCGLAQAPDGSLLVTDDVKGTVYKISYKG